MQRYLSSAQSSLAVMIFCVFIYIISSLSPVNLNQFGIIPRSPNSLLGIFYAPFLHANWQHLFSNFFPFVIFGTLIGLESVRRFWLIFTMHIIATGFLVWLFARGDSVHIGMSGVIYAFWGYLVVYGFVRRNMLHILISLMTLIFYGGLVSGILPTSMGVSFESHMLGSIVGAVSGYYFARSHRSVC
ncbi:MAG: rhomboid family intramembrane serine protease [Psychromonas sp.]